MKTVLVRRLMNRLGGGLTVLAVILALIPLGAMIGFVLVQGGTSLSLDFFLNTPQPAGTPGGGMSSQIVGTLLLILIASLIGLPIGIGSGVYLARDRHPRFGSVVRFVTDVVAGTPSIVAGVVAYAVVVIPFGFSAIAGGIALALLMFPTVTRATEEAIRLVPVAIREGGLALGLPEWITTVRVVLPAAGPGIITAVMLGIARVAGETAPLYLTVFGSDAMSVAPGGPVGALPLEIWKYAQTPYADLIRQAWAGAFVLFALILLLNLSARLLTYRLARRTGAT